MTTTENYMVPIMNRLILSILIPGYTQYFHQPQSRNTDGSADILIHNGQGYGL